MHALVSAAATHHSVLPSSCRAHLHADQQANRLLYQLNFVPQLAAWFVLRIMLHAWFVIGICTGNWTVQYGSTHEFRSLVPLKWVSVNQGDCGSLDLSRRTCLEGLHFLPAEQSAKSPRSRLAGAAAGEQLNDL